MELNQETLERLMAIIHLGPPFSDEVGVGLEWHGTPPTPQEVIEALIQSFEMGNEFDHQ